MAQSTHRPAAADRHGPRVARTLLVASTGGHLKELCELRPRLPFPLGEVVWVTNDSPQSRVLLAGQRVLTVPYLGSRNPAGTAAVALRAARILRELRPERVISTGSGIALAFLPQAPLHGARAYYIESGTRVRGPSLTGRALARLPWVRRGAQYEGWPGWPYAGSVLDGFTPEPVEARPVRRVVVTLGTWKQDFGALCRRLAASLPAGADVLWQVGHTDVSDLGIRGRAWVPPDELAAALRAADLVVTHAGMGATLDALEAGHCPVVVPRRAAEGEQVDDHQLELAGELARRGLAVVRLPERLDDAALREAAGQRVRRNTAIRALSMPS